MILPELSLLVGTPGRLGCLLGVGMNIVERKVFECDLHLLFVGFSNFGEFRLNSGAVGSLEVRELDNRDRRVRWTAHGGTVECDLDERRLQLQLDLGRLAQRPHELLLLLLLLGTL